MHRFARVLMWLGPVVIIACDESGRCESLTGDDMCGPALQGVARIEGVVLSDEGAPIDDVEVTALCHDVGVQEDRTNDAGEFAIRFEHAVFEPDDDIESGEPFVRFCDVFVSPETGVDSVPVTFYPPGDAIEPIELELTVGATS